MWSKQCEISADNVWKLEVLQCITFFQWTDVGFFFASGSLWQSEEEIVGMVDKDLRTMLLKPDAPAPQIHGVRTWPQAIPQFTIGHLDTLESAKRALQAASLDGVFLGGNYVVGVALGRCVEGAYESAQAISQFVSQLPVRTDWYTWVSPQYGFFFF